LNEIPTAFMVNEERQSYLTSGRSATTADAMSRSSAGPTKPSL